MSDVMSTLTVVNGASYIKIKKEKKKKIVDDAVAGIDYGKANVNRKPITNFTDQSRSRMMYMLAQMKTDALPCFVTLTYPKVFSDNSRDWKKHLQIFCKRLMRRFPQLGGIWKLEPQRRGAPHYHLLLWNVSEQDLLSFVPYAWNDVVARGDVDHLRWHLGRIGNDPCVKQTTAQKQIFHYVLKYVSKAVIQNWREVGKWWGVIYKQNLPLGTEVVFEITERDANVIIRYMRRFTGYGYGRTFQTRQQVCNADQWMEKLQTVSMGTYKDWLDKIEGYNYD